MKAPWFPFYTGDFLASSDVQLMEAHEVGAYVLLLAHSWQSDKPGYLPNDEARLRRLGKLSAAQWADSRDLLLAKFPVAEDEALRFNPRLVKEAGKQVEIREMKAEAGRKSAERRAALATQGQQKPNTNPTPVEIPATDVGQNANYSQPQSQPQSTSVDEGASHPALQPLKANPAKQMAVALTDPADEQHWSVGPLTKPAAFQAICERLGFLDIDFELYRRQALVAAEDDDISRTIKQWGSWVRNYLNNQTKNGPLLKPGAGASLPAEPTPKHLLPKPGQETPGQRIYIDGVPGDQNLDRMKAATYLGHFPKATIVSLAYPQNPYQNR